MAEHRSNKFSDSLIETRLAALSNCASSLQEIINEYEDASKIRCPKQLFHCDSLVLGGLIRYLKAERIYPPSLETFESLTVEQVLGCLRGIGGLGYCSLELVNTWSAEVDCCMHERLYAIATTLKEETEGVALTSV